MDETPNLGLPYIAAAQSQKHVTHNEAIRELDAVVQLSVRDRDLTAPPASPENGDRYIVAGVASGEWSGREGEIAAFQDGAWAFHAPREGWLAWVGDEDMLVAFDGTAWVGAISGALNPAPLLGINATADVTNRLSVSAPAALLNHEGAGHQLKVNKAAETDTASLLFQTAFSGRAEMGTTGDDDFHIKVSTDGVAFKEGLVVAAASGTPRIPAMDVAGLPGAATAGEGALVFVRNETGGGVLAFSDGSDWRRTTDRAVVA